MNVKKLLISAVIAIAIGIAVWWGLNLKNTINSLKMAFGLANPKLSIGEGLKFDVVVTLTNPTDKSITVQNVDVTGMINGQSAGAIVPGTYSVEIKENANSTLTIPYIIPIADLLTIVGMKVADIGFGEGSFINKIKDSLLNNMINFKGTIKALNITVPINETINLRDNLKF